MNMSQGFWKSIKKPIIGLSPMDGVTDAAFRLIVAKYGNPSISFTEFTSVEAIKYGAIKALKAFKYSNMERPVIAQIYGKTLDAFYNATLIACEMGFDGIDINMGCPSKGVAGNGAGAALIKEPEFAKKIIRTCIKASKDWSEGQNIDQNDIHPDIKAFLDKLNLDFPRKLIPISVKTRIGFDTIITEEWISNLLETKPAAISIHGRTLKQMYSGEANWEEIKKAAKIIKQTETLVLGNGDIKNLTDAKSKIEYAGTDGALIGRASFGNPWVFNGKNATLAEKLIVALEQSKAHSELLGEPFDPIKKHLCWYCKDFDGAKETRMELMQSKNFEEVQTILKNKISQKS
ncbi:hypothetical protein GF376_02595 [Candidatus Peregrinibacteria bacterium]|nr:hypothetical protein [Candidatus Peregrinibacteria bacterium]